VIPVHRLLFSLLLLLVMAKRKLFKLADELQGLSMNRMMLILMFAMLSENVAAEWVRIGENNRSVAYADTVIKRSGNTAIVWVLFDYKTMQESQLSGRRYWSEKGQREFDCQAEKERVLFFSWHAERMGDGVVVYAGKKPTEWGPTSAPGSAGKLFWQFSCGRK